MRSSAIFTFLGELITLGRRRAVGLVHGVQFLELGVGKSVELSLDFGVGGHLVLLGELELGRAVGLVHSVQVLELRVGKSVKLGLDFGVGGLLGELVGKAVGVEMILDLRVGGHVVLLSELILGRGRAVSLVHGVQFLKLGVGKSVKLSLELRVGGHLVLLSEFILGRRRAVGLVHSVQFLKLGVGKSVKLSLEF